jgi:alkanesulfonate monooxygenase SsuD/methylene tetrahydromethanopterin reductase-like flavin-dependent oxidoreductase (luciferase family)
VTGSQPTSRTADLLFGLTLANRGVLLGLTTPAELLDLAERAEGSGWFESVWVGDSLFAKPRLDALTLLAAIAGRTRRVLLGPACLASFPLRNPLVFAYEWASLDQISGGRTALIVCAGGLGAGDWAAEARAVGVAPGERQRRLEEHVTILRRLWSEDHVTHEGRFFRFEDVTLAPKPVQQPCPIWLANNPWTVPTTGAAGTPGPGAAAGAGASADPAARTERALRRVARFADGWQTHSLTPETFAEYWRTIKAYARDEGRDPDRLDNCYYHNVNVNEDREAAMAETKRFLDLYYSTSYTRERIERWSALGSPEACVENLRRFRGTGMRRITLRLCSWDQRGQLERVVREVLPHVNA